METRLAILAALQNAPSILVPLIREIPPGNLKRRPAPDKWSAHEHMCHLAAVHDIMSSRLDLMLSQDNPAISPYNPSDHDPDALMHADLEQAVQNYARQRKDILSRLHSLSPEQWQRTARHVEYSHYSVFIMCRHMALHDLLHAYRIEELLLKKDWQA